MLLEFKVQVGKRSIRNIINGSSYIDEGLCLAMHMSLKFTWETTEEDFKQECDMRGFRSY